MSRDAKIVSLAQAWQAANPAPELADILSGARMPLVRFAAFGDSITTPASGAFSWVNYLSTTATYVGGYSHGGYKAQQIAAETVPVYCDVAVVMAGTNDIGPAPWGTDPAAVLTGIRDIVVKSQAPTAIVSAVAPRNGAEAQRTLEHNARVKAYCTAMGWTFTDPWVTVRAGDGQWAHPSLTTDGIHPTAASAERYARDVLPAIRSLCW